LTLARVTVVATDGEAEVICSLLRSEGIECWHQGTDLTPGTVGISMLPGWHAVMVDEHDLPRARALVASAE